MSQSPARRRKSRATLVRTALVVAAFVVLLAYMLLIEARRAPPPAPDATPTPHPILRWKMDDLRSIRVADGERATRLDRLGDEWRVTGPADVAAPADADGDRSADPRAIHWPLLELAGLEARRLVSQEVSDKAAYGLDSPTLEIEIEDLSGQRERLTAGRETPDGTAFYVQREGDPRLYIVDHYKIQLLQEWLSAPPYLATSTPSAAQ